MENRINIGELDTLVAIYAPVREIGAAGQTRYTYSLHSNVYGRVSRDFDESVGSGNLNMGQTVGLTIYKIEGLNTRWRVVIDGKTYGINGLDPVSRWSPLCELALYNIEGA